SVVATVYENRPGCVVCPPTTPPLPGQAPEERPCILPALWWACTPSRYFLGHPECVWPWQPPPRLEPDHRHTRGAVGYNRLSPRVGCSAHFGSGQNTGAS